MTKSLTHINNLIADSDPSNNVSYNKYLKDLTSVSNILLGEEAQRELKDRAILNQVIQLADSPEKTTILQIINIQIK